MGYYEIMSAYHFQTKNTWIYSVLSPIEFS